LHINFKKDEKKELKSLDKPLLTLAITLSNSEGFGSWVLFGGVAAGFDGVPLAGQLLGLGG